MKLDDTRRDILAAAGHLLVEGGPGCGKTTIALLKARAFADSLEPEQRVLFLSFSRAAVRQISDRMFGIFSSEDRDRLEIRTFHAFFLDMVRSHGRMLTGEVASFITPDREALLKADFEGNWEEETKRLALQEGRFVFDQLAAAAASLLEASNAVRLLYSDAYPVVIVDEFQDTNIDQWRAVKALSEFSVVVCLADPDQRIFDHIKGVDEERVEHAVEYLKPRRFDLSRDNHRSPGNGLLDYANAVLRNDLTAAVPENVRTFTYRYPTPCDLLVHRLLLALQSHLEEQLGRPPSIAVLGRVNAFVGRLSESIATEKVIDSQVIPPVDHELNWDADLAAAAGFVVASIMEWPGLDRNDAIANTLRAIADFYRVKLSNGVAGAVGKIKTMERAIVAFGVDETVRAKSAKLIIAAFDAGIDLTGDPVDDWQSARSILKGSAELDELFAKVRLLRLLKATDALAWSLLDAWDGQSAYVDAAATVQRVLANEALEASHRDPAPVTLMSMHKSKGKEFDGVIIAEDSHQSRLLNVEWDDKRLQENRRLLRVAITRARHMVVFVRPPDAVPLIR
ncbi:UvrD-helicase domain-containing protein [Prescottella equi]|uniref:DNA 3'-5' helicase n=1 Tax=Prescottella equi ATCC 33707 TaxID=525370 RepID=E9SWG7_RHOHA|nr:UvrD-helicase domain-containing protein [Prescottella equi]EGD25913.1 UvrD/REP helicase [Prescottella equi ATCC 33707]